VAVASERTDEAASGTVELIVPGGWEVSPADRVFNLAPGAYLAFDAQVRPAAGATPGRYFVAARITDDAGDSSEDVVTIDLGRGTDGRGPKADDGERSASLAWAVQRALSTAGIEPDPGIPTDYGSGREPGGELEMDVALDEVAGRRCGRPSATRPRASSGARPRSSARSRHGRRSRPGPRASRSRQGRRPS
jgi:hypothetical protein